MTPKEKAEEFFEKLYSCDSAMDFTSTKKCAIIAVDEIIGMKKEFWDDLQSDYFDWWQKVKEEIKGKEYAPTSNEIQKEINATSDEIFGQELFNYFSNQHNISLLQSEMHDIIDIVKKMEQPEISDEEIEKAAEQKYQYLILYKDIKGMIISAQRGAWVDAIKWYREQLKTKQ